MNPAFFAAIIFVCAFDPKWEVVGIIFMLNFKEICFWTTKVNILYSNMGFNFFEVNFIINN